jgi:hypothetical protein
MGCASSSADERRRAAPGVPAALSGGLAEARGAPASQAAAARVRACGSPGVWRRHSACVRACVRACGRRCPSIGRVARPHARLFASPDRGAAAGARPPNALRLAHTPPPACLQGRPSMGTGSRSAAGSSDRLAGLDPSGDEAGARLRGATRRGRARGPARAACRAAPAGPNRTASRCAPRRTPPPHASPPPPARFLATHQPSTPAARRPRIASWAPAAAT